MGRSSVQRLIADEDMHCGHIFFNEPTKKLKFLCSFCDLTLKSIKCYCEHLAEHVIAITQGMADMDDNVADVVAKPKTQKSNVLAKQGGATKNAKSMTVKFSKNIILNDAAIDANNVDDLPCSKLMEEHNYTECVIESNEQDAGVTKIEPAGMIYEVVNMEDMILEATGIELKSNDMLMEAADIKSESISMPLERDNIKSESNSMHLDAIEMNDMPLDATEMTLVTTELRATEIHLTSKGMDFDLNPESDNSLEPTDSPEHAICLEKSPTNCNNDHNDYEKLIGAAAILNKSTPILSLNGNTLPLVNPQTPNVRMQTKTNGKSAVKNQFKAKLLKSQRTPNTNATNVQLQTDIKPFNPQTLASTTLVMQEPEASPAPFKNYYGTQQLKCHICNLVFCSPTKLFLHSRIHCGTAQINQNKVPHKCNKCNESFMHVKELQLHQHDTHESQDFTCRICTRTGFKTGPDFIEHLQKHDNTDIFRCYKCGRRYFLESNLLAHVQRHAKPENKACVVCGKVTSRMVQHMKIHVPRPTRPILCPICNQQFSFSSAVSRHVRVMHLQPRPEKPKKTTDTNTVKRRRLPRKKSLSAENMTVAQEVVVQPEEAQKVIVEML